MSIEQHLIAPCSIVNATNHDAVEVDVAAIPRRLILFDTYILSSIRLKEFPNFVNAFGFEGTVELLRSARLKIQCQAVTIAQTGQAIPFRSSADRKPLPPHHFSFGTLHASNQNEYIHRCLQEIQKIEAPLKAKIKLTEAILDEMVVWPTTAGQEALSQLEWDLRSNSPLVKSMLISVLRQELGSAISDVSVQIHIEETQQGDFHAITNLQQLSLDEDRRHKIVERALLAVGGLNYRIEEMKTHNAISGFSETESGLFSEKLGFLLRGLSSNAKEKDFQRVLKVGDFPDFDPSRHTIDIPKLLEILATKELIEFRQWFSSIGSATDAEIRDRVSSLRARLGSAVQSDSGRIVRFIASAASGFIPVAGPAVGLLAGGIDSFLVDKVLPTSGVWTFLNKMYPSIFKND